ncbi:MAG TPA: trypsin-like serine protease [Candidatus Limnocylindrales bacterium]|nr:trypsin-like serine protease [Candidatus Limnocylindrales bacterium]
MRQRLFALAFALGLVLTTALPAAAITGKSWTRDFDHPFVGLAAFYDQDWVFIHRCTAELLSPRVALTAGHCTNDDSLPNGAVAAHARIWFLQDVGSHYDVNTQHDDVTGYPDSCTGTMGAGLGDWCAESSTMFNYGFDNFAGFPNIHDVGIVVLDQAIDEPEYATLASANTVDTLNTAKGTQDVTMRVSGYGLSYSLTTPVRGGGVGTAQTLSFRERLTALESITNLHDPNTAGFAIQANGNGNDRGGTCSGDSGGPVFWPQDSNQVVAVTSWGVSNAGCRGNGYYYRTDRGEVLDWIHSVVGDELWSEITVS